MAGTEADKQTVFLIREYLKNKEAQIQLKKENLPKVPKITKPVKKCDT